MKNIVDYLEDIAKDNEYKNSADLDHLLKSIHSYIKTMKLGDSKCNKIMKLCGIKFDPDNKSDYVYGIFQEIVDNYNRGNYMKCLETMYPLLYDKKGKEWALDKVLLKKNDVFFRMRGQEKYNLYKEEEMFHMPFDKIHILPDGRFNISGFPCLYLGQSLYVCWEETRRPDLDKVNYVAYKCTKDINVLSTLCPQSLESERDVIQFYIFALCTTIVEQDSDRFKFQYVIPELLLQVFMKYMQEDEDGEDDKNGKDRLYGIKYLSSRYFHPQELFNVKHVFYNYVIPTRKRGARYCEELCSLFRLSEVRSGYLDKIGFKTYLPPKIVLNNYDASYFRSLELEILKTKFKKINTSE